nr:hypothetical protein GCM10020093_034030 [Planobispora longispora]
MGGGVRALNEYGPTEISVANSTYAVDGPVDGEIVPIGVPIPNTTMYVLDRQLEPVPAGVVGEIYIGGAGVARGYNAMPARTAERFVPDPYGGPAPASIARATSRPCARAVTSTSSAGPTTRSRSAVTGSSRARSRPS